MEVASSQLRSGEDVEVKDSRKEATKGGTSHTGSQVHLVGADVLKMLELEYLVSCIGSLSLFCLYACLFPSHS